LLIGKLEGYSYLALLFIAMPLKYLTHLPIAVRIAGSIHGALFVAFVIIILMVVRKKQLTTENAMYAFLLSLIPFGTFFLKKLL
jgi:integral membrane protein